MAHHARSWWLDGALPDAQGPIPPPEPIPGLGAYAWWRADTGVSLSVGRVVQWADLLEGLVLAAPGASERPTFVASSASFAGEPVLSFDGANVLASTLAAAQWAFLHAPAGGTAIVCARQSGAAALRGVCGTTSYGASKRGFSFDVSATQFFRWAPLGGGASPYSVQRAGPALGTPHYSIFARQGANTAFRATGVAYQEVALFAYLASELAPDSTLTVGRDSSVDGAWWLGEIAEIIVTKTKLSEEKQAQVADYMTGRYGVGA